MMILGMLFTLLAGLFSPLVTHPLEGAMQDNANASSLQGDTPPSLDEQFLEVSDRVPEFAGLYYDEGDLVIALKATPQDREALESEVKAAVTAVFGEDVRDSPIRFAPVDYSYLELAGWYGRLEPGIFSFSGVIQSSIDEVRNRIVIGVEDLAARPAVERLLREAKVPMEAVVIEQVEPLRELG
jgi:hypothetical protein